MEHRPPSAASPAWERGQGRLRRAAVVLAPAGTAVALTAAVALAAVLRFGALGRQGLWYDEAVTGWLLRGTPGQMLAAIPHSESTPPLYYLLAWGCVRLLGDTETGLRSLSALAGILTVPVAFAAARQLVGRRAGVIAALLVAVNPLLVWYSQEARAYALLSLATAVTIWLLARARARPTAGRLLAWGVAAAVAATTHYFALFVVVPEALLVLADRRARASWRLLAVTPAVVAAGALGALAVQQRTRHYWFADAPLGGRVREIGSQFLAGFSAPATDDIVAAAIAAVAAGVVLLVLRGDGRERRGAAVAGFVGAGAVGIPILLALRGADYVNTRNVLGAVVPLTVVVAAGLGVRRAAGAGIAATALLVAVSLSALAAIRDDPLAQRPGWHEVADALRAGAPHRAILLRGSSTWARPLGFYLPHTWWMPRHGARVAEVDVLRRMPSAGDCRNTTWWGAMCDVGARPPLGHPPAPGFHRVATTRVAGFAITRYRAARPLPVAPSRHAVKRHLLLTPTTAPVMP